MTKQVKKFIYSIIGQTIRLSNWELTELPAFGVALFVSSGFDIWLYNNVIDGYLIIRFVNWVYTTAVIILVAYYLDRELGKNCWFSRILLLKGELEKDV